MCVSVCVQIESDAFRGQSRVKQHRLVYEALGDECKDVHALQITTTVGKEKE